jgi:hypothetical protein
MRSVLLATITEVPLYTYKFNFSLFLFDAGILFNAAAIRNRLSIIARE